ncbi:MAG: spore maturation protein [Clostridia bacterium]|nr:spore maturation protein [Clostridia bacterium]
MSGILPILIIFVFGYGLIHKIPIFTHFCDGVKDGLKVCLQIFPTLLLVLVSVAVFRASGGMDILISFLSPVCQFFSIPPQILPLALVRPLSGGGALSVCEDLLKTFGADSVIGRMAAVLSASTETTFYTLGIYLPRTKQHGTGKILACAVVCDVITLIVTVLLLS